MKTIKIILLIASIASLSSIPASGQTSQEELQRRYAASAPSPASYSGPDSEWVHQVLSTVNSYSCVPAKAPVVPKVKTCNRDGEIYKAQVLAWASECSAETGHPGDAVTDAAQLVATLKTASQLCQEKATGCDTDNILSCSKLQSLQGQNANAPPDITKPTPAQISADPQRLDLAVVQQRAAAGDAAMQHELGKRYLDGRSGLAKDEKLAFTWSLKAAEAGSVSAQDAVAYDYDSGRGVKKNQKLSSEWGAKAVAGYKKLADQGDIDAEIRLGELYEAGFLVSKDRTRAEEYLLTAASQGSAKAENALSVFYSLSTDPAARVADMQRSAYWKQKSAEDGYDWGQVALANTYKVGYVVPLDLLVAKSLLEKALSQSSDSPAYIRSDLDKVNDAIAHDPATQQRAADHRVLGPAELASASLELVTDRAFEGNSDAQYELGQRFEAGKISHTYSEQNPLMASFWYDKAAKQGNQVAAAQLKRLPAQARSTTYNARTATKEDWQAEVERLTREVESAEQDAVNAEALSRSYSENASKASSTGTSMADLLVTAMNSGAAIKYQSNASKARQKANSLRARLDALGAQQPAEVTQNTNSTIVGMNQQTGDAYAANNVALEQQRTQLNGTLQQLNDIGAQNAAARTRQGAQNTRSVSTPNSVDRTAQSRAPARQTGTAGSGEAKPADCVVEDTHGPCIPLAEWARTHQPATSSTTAAVCPASGFVPGVMRQAGDTAQGVQCTPGQPYTTSASTTSNHPPASVSSPSSGKETVSGMSTCLTSSYANGEYGLSLTFTNACPVAVRVRFFVGPKDNGNDKEIASGAQWISPWTAASVQRQGAVSYFACPTTYPVFAASDGRGVESGTRSYHCEKKTY